MTGFSSLYEFTDQGMDLFQQAFEGRLDEAVIDPTDPALASRISGTKGIVIQGWPTSREMAQAIVDACGSVPIGDLLRRPGLWAWLSFVLRDQVYPRLKTGQRKLGEVHRWYPANIDDYQKGQRHLVRMPVLLLSSFGSDADHLLCGAPSVPGEVREQLTSQQDMFHPTIQAATRMLYFDTKTGNLRRGVSGKGAGSARRFAQVRKQLDVTWDLFAISPEQLFEKLPKEFDRFKNAIPSPSRTTEASVRQHEERVGGGVHA
jgi:hypothetical protein